MTGPSQPGDATVAGRTSSVRWVSVAVGVVVAALLVLLGWQVATGGDEQVRSTVVGRAAPAVAGTAIDGRTVDIDRDRGSWVLVNFFATWCVPCVREHPELVEFSQRHAPGGPGVPVSVVSVAFDDNPEAIATFFAERGGDWPVLATDTGPIALDYGVRGVPESFLISPAGQVVGLFYGVTADELDDAIDAWEASAAGTDPAAGAGLVP